MASLKFHDRDQRWRLVEFVGRVDGRNIRRSKSFMTEQAALDYAHANGITVEDSRGRNQAGVIAHLAANSATDDSGCQVWIGELTNRGYGRLTWRDSAGVTQRGAHRVAYVASGGTIPDGKVIDHLCRNRTCIRVDHLEPVTSQENTLRSPVALAAINAAKTACPAGHPYTADNTVWGQRSGRLCRTCQAARQRTAVPA